MEIFLNLCYVVFLLQTFYAIAIPKNFCSWITLANRNMLSVEHFLITCTRKQKTNNCVKAAYYKHTLNAPMLLLLLLKCDLYTHCLIFFKLPNFNCTFDTYSLSRFCVYLSPKTALDNLTYFVRIPIESNIQCSFKALY